MLITAGTRALQRFVLKHASELFQERPVMTRKPDPGLPAK